MPCKVQIFCFLSEFILTMLHLLICLLQLDDDADGKCLEPSVFEEIIDLFELMQKDMLANILSFVFDDVKARSRSYRHER